MTPPFALPSSLKPLFSLSLPLPLPLRPLCRRNKDIARMEMSEQLLLQHRLQMVEQQQLQQRRTQQRRVPVPEPHRPPVPDHPPYAEMVGVALRALAEPGGSSERSISDYIISYFTGLPPAHDKFLPYYLGKLVTTGYLCVPSPGRYLLSEDPNPESIPQHRRRRPATAVPVPVDFLGAPPAPRRRGRPPKHRAGAAVSAERPPAPARRPRGRPRKHPLSVPLDGAVQKRKMIVRPRTRSSSSSSVGAAPTNHHCEVGSSNEEEEDSGQSESQPSEDASCVSNGLSLAPMSLDYKADEEPLLLDPMQCLPEGELVWGLPMQPEPEAELWLAAAASPKPERAAMAMSELFGGKAADLRLPSDSSMAPATPLAEHCDPAQSPVLKEQVQRNEQALLHQDQAQVSVTMQSTVEEDNKMELQEVSS